MNSTTRTNPTADEYCSVVVNNVEEAQKLIETGFEYICNHENVMLFRKRR